jgi:uncharacterized protein YfaS (alpha-2-macroglobulin family)
MNKKYAVVAVAIFLSILLAFGAWKFLLATPEVYGFRSGEVLEISQNAPVRLDFSVPMDRKSVEENLQIQKLQAKDKSLLASEQGVFLSLADSKEDLEKFFVLEESPAFDFEWSGNSLFVKNIALEKDDFLKINLKKSAQSYFGKNLAAGENLTLRVVEKPQIEVTHPQAGEILRQSDRVTFVFNRPMVALSELDSMGNKNLNMEISPQIDGDFKWISGKTLQFVPKNLQPAQKLKFTIPEGARSLDGGVFEEDFVLEISSTPPEINNSGPKIEKVSGANSSVFLEFNAAVDLAELQKNLKFYETHLDQYTDLNAIDSASAIEEMIEQYSWREIGARAEKMNENQYRKIFALDESEEVSAEILANMALIVPREKLALKKNYAVVIAENAKVIGGDLGLAKGFAMNFQTAGDFSGKIANLPEDGIFPAEYFSFLLQFTSPPDMESLEKAFTLFKNGEKTKLKFSELNPWNNENELHLYPRLQAGQSYKVVIDKQARDIFGQTLQEDLAFEFKIGNQAPSAEILSSGTLLLANSYKKPEIFLRTTNVSSVDLELYEVDFDQFAQNSLNDFEQEISAEFLNKIGEFTVKTQGKTNQAEDFEIGLEKHFDIDQFSGIYMLKFSEQDGKRFEGNQIFLNFSDTALLLKKSRSKALIWATDLQSGQPITNLDIELLVTEDSNDAAKTRIIKGKTNAQGLFESAEIPEIGGADSYSSGILAIANRNGKKTITSESDNDGIAAWNLDLNYNYSGESVYSYIYTDKPLYKPGQEVHLKGIVREDKRGLVVPDARQVEVIVTDGVGDEIYSKTLNLNPRGAFTDSFVLPVGASFGSALISATLRSGDAEKSSSYGYATANFLIASYVKPEFALSVDLEKESYLQGEKAKAAANLDYFFGGGVADAEIKWTLSARDYFFDKYEDPYFSFDEEVNFCGFGQCQGDEQLISSGSGKSAASGKFELEIPLEKEKDTLSKLYQLEMTATDLSGRPVSARKFFPVHKSDLYLGLKNRSYVASAGENFTLDLVSVNAMGEKAPNTAVELVLTERVWETVRKQNVDGFYYYENSFKDLEIEKKSVKTDSAGKAEVSFKAPKSGFYMIKALGRDKSGNEVKSANSIYISGGTDAFWGRSNNDIIELISDKKSYKPGETAKLLLKSPYSSAKALVTTETNEILSSQVIDITSAAQTIEIPISEESIPGFFVSVVPVKGSKGEDSNEEFKIAYTYISVENESKRLNLELDFDKELYQPRDEVNLKFKTKTASGAPVSAELSVAVVDESLLSLVPEINADLLKFFYGGRSLGVDTAINLTNAISRINLLLSAGSKGGGGGSQVGNFLRSEFKDLAFYQAELLTDEKGEAALKFQLPDNLTSWRVITIAFTKESFFGSDSSSFRVSKDFLLQPVLPNYASVGDEFEIGLLIHNTANSAQKTKLEFALENLEIVNNAPKIQEITINANEKKLISWQVKALSADNFSVKFLSKQDSIQLSRPIFPTVFAERASFSGIVDPNSSINEFFHVPKTVDLSRGSLQVKASVDLFSTLTQSAKRLFAYPYACAEQTASAIIAHIAGAKLLGADDEIFSQNSLDEKIAHLQSMRKYSGAYGLWADSQENLFVSAYAYYAQSLAGVDEEKLYLTGQYILDALKNRDFKMNEFPERKTINTEELLALFTLSTASDQLRDEAFALANFYFTNRQDANISGKALLGLALHNFSKSSALGDAEKTNLARNITQLKNEILAAKYIEKSGTYFTNGFEYAWNFDSDLRATALVLEFLQQVDPQNSQINQIIKHLIGKRYDGYWLSTQDSAWSILALIKTLGEPDLNAALQAEIEINDKSVVSANKSTRKSDFEAEIPFTNFVADGNWINDFSLKNAGKQKIFYDLALEYFLPKNLITAKEEGFVVLQQYFAQTDSNYETELQSAKSGEIVRGRILLIVPRERNFVVIEDLLPAGLEALDFNLLTTESADMAEDDSAWQWSYFNHFEVTDKSVRFFADYLPAGTYELEYFARAQTKGDFTDLPAKAHEMYDANSFGQSSVRDFTVQ